MDAGVRADCGCRFGYRCVLEVYMHVWVQGLDAGMGTDVSIGVCVHGLGAVMGTYSEACVSAVCGYKCRYK